MASVQDKVQFLAPGLNPDPADLQTAIDMSPRPACLSEDEQDTAQALYAAWLLSSRSQSGGNAAFGNVQSMSEGQLSVTFGSSGQVFDPSGFLGRYNRLAAKCGHKMVRGRCMSYE